MEDVHFFRTTTKRLRALLQLIRPVISETAFERENAWLKRAACRLASSRDRAVAGKTLKALAKSAPSQLPPGTLSRRPGAAAHRVQAPSNGNHQRAMSQGARHLEQARRGLHRLRIGAEGWAAIGPGLLRVYRQARRRMQASFAHPTGLAFHRWRIRVKHLYYQLEWLEPVRPKRFAAMLRRLHRLEEKLGAITTSLCSEDAKKAPRGLANPDDTGVKRSAIRKSKRLRRSSKPLGAKVFREKPGGFHRKCRRMPESLAKRNRNQVRRDMWLIHGCARLTQRWANAAKHRMERPVSLFRKKKPAPCTTNLSQISAPDATG